MPGKTKALKQCDMEIRGLGLPVVDYTDSGLPKADTLTMKTLAGDPKNKKYGYAYDFFKYYFVT